MLIYKATNMIDSKSYIGQTSFSLKKRMLEHLKASKKTTPPLYFHRAIKKYGWNNFKWEVLEKINSPELLIEAESFYIRFYKTMYNKNGYNLIMNGVIGYDNFTNNPNKEKIRERISKGTKKGILKSNVSWSDSHKRQKNGMFGRKHTKDSIKLMKKNRKGLTAGDKNSSVINAGIYKIYPPGDKSFEIKNLRKFCRDNNIHHKHMYDICNGKRKKRYKGYWCERLYIDKGMIRGGSDKLC